MADIGVCWAWESPGDDGVVQPVAGQHVIGPSVTALLANQVPGLLYLGVVPKTLGAQTGFICTRCRQVVVPESEGVPHESEEATAEVDKSL